MDATLEALFLPFAQKQLNWPDQAKLFLRARSGNWQHQFDCRQLDCEQTFKPITDALQLSGASVTNQASGDYAHSLLLPPKQRHEARALFARAWQVTEEGGIVIAAQANNLGARSAEKDFADLVGQHQVLSKHKCRVFWTIKSAQNGNAKLLNEWAELDAPRTICDGRFISRPGVFSWDRIDPASALLAAQLPITLSGSGADLGAGFGFLASHVLSKCKDVSVVDLYEAELRALEMAQINIANLKLATASEFHWHDVSKGLLGEYDFIVSNPPFHVDRRDLPELGRQFIIAAANALKPNGEFWMVANRHLPYEECLKKYFAQVTLIADQSGFKVYCAQKATKK